MNFTKVQGAGNDFILVAADKAQRDWSKLALAMCHRHFGIGADGLLVMLPSNNADLKLRVFNPDGSEAEACGNGLRCLVKYALYKGLANDKAAEISIETMAGIRKARLHTKGKVTIIQVAMGEPKFGAKEIPLAIEIGKKPILDYPVKLDGRELPLSFVAIGNPHAVYFCQQLVADFPLSQLGPKVENLSIFPNRVNFEVARVVSRKQIEARVWERGAGETLACGSGACAIAVLARLHDYINSKVDIKLPGGILSVEWAGAGEVFLSGPAEIVFSGEWPDEDVKTG
jgi:diaminopimelate epimerase